MSSQGEGVLAVGSGTFLISLVQAWCESGLSKITVLVTNTQPTDAEELKIVVEQALHSGLEVALNIVDATEDNEMDWEAAVRPFSFIAYVAQHGDLEELQKLQGACLLQKKTLLPAIGLRGVGMAGPLLHLEGEGRFESAWRRVHATVFPVDWDTQPLSSSASFLLSNLIVNEWHQLNEGEPNCINQCYILNPLTLEGSWHPIIPHPSLSGYEPARLVMDLELKLGTDHKPDTEEWLSWFSSLTSEVSGIFHVWGEGALHQLPLAQCLVQPVDPLSEGPASLLPAIVSSALTHVEARGESGLAGLESYIARMVPLLVPDLLSRPQEEIHIGAGFTFAEAVGRGLSAHLTKELDNRTLHHEPVLTRMECTRVEDIHCRFYSQALSIQVGEPLIASGESLLGFPVVWVQAGDSWYGSVGLNMTLALRESLDNALMKTESVSPSSVTWSDDKPQSVTIPNGDCIDYASGVRSAVQTLKQHRRRLEVFDLRCESFLRDRPVEVVGILLGREDTP